MIRCVQPVRDDLTVEGDVEVSPPDVEGKLKAGNQNTLIELSGSIS
jgi:hypothetical protein